jgi:hypothetical protein
LGIALNLRGSEALMVEPQVRIATLALVLTALLGATSGCGHTRAGGDVPVGPPVQFGLEHSDGPETALADGLLTLDEIEQGGRTSRTLFVRNASQSAIGVKDVVSSCDCVTLDGLPVEIAPGLAESIELRINLEHAPNFVGEMQVEVSLLLRDASAADLESIPLRIRFRVVPQTSPG